MIDFPSINATLNAGWDSVTRPLDRLPERTVALDDLLGFSHQTP